MARAKPTAQPTQDWLSALSVKPGSHGVQALEPGAESPLGQAAQSAVPPRLNVLLGQSSQAVRSSLDFVPLLQMVHDEAPLPVLTYPSAQPVHSVLSELM